MLEQELKEIWKNSSQEEKINFDLSSLIVDLNKKMNQLNKTIRRRDRSEIGASVFGMVAFLYFAYEIPFPLTKIACILTVFWFVYVIFKLKKNKRQKLAIDLSLSFREQMTRQKANILQEVSLLNAVIYWYVLPPVLINVLFIVGFGHPMDYDWSPWLVEKLIIENKLDLLPISLNMKLLYICGIVIFNAFVIWINKRAVNKNLKPLIENTEQVIDQLEDEN